MAIRKSTKKGAKKGTKKRAKRARPGGNVVTVNLPRPLYTFLEHLSSILLTQTGNRVRLNEELAQALCDAIGGNQAAVLRLELDRAYVAVRGVVTVEGIIP